MKKLNETGVPSKELVLTRFPKEEDQFIRAKAVTECYEEIPCNPCSTSCPFDAIYVGEDINTPPVVDFDSCTGCGVCVYNCPGLAIFTVSIKDNKAIFKIPYEFVPYPDGGKRYEGLNRAGEVICTAKVERVQLSKTQDKTALVTVSVPKEYIHEFITIGEQL